MNIADKLTQITERMPMVYEAGQQSMVDESKIIEKTVVEPTVISLDDVSEVPHEVSVQLIGLTMTDYSGVEVTVIGENLFDAKKYPLIVGREIWALTGTMTYGGGSTMCGTEVYVPCSSLRGKTITILHTTSIGTNRGVAFYDDDKTYISGVINNGGTKLTATIPDNATYYRFSMDAAYIDVAQIYETNNEKTYTANADGSVKVKSLSPYMTILPDINDEVIYVTYHKSWGMQTEYDRFWDAFQNNGGTVNGTYMFAGYNWNNEIYNPKYPIILSGGGTGLFRFTALTNIKVLVDVTATPDVTHLFNWGQMIKTIPLLKVSENNIYTDWFSYCIGLEEIRFEGTIGKSLDLHYSTKLSAESLINIINHLGGTASATLTLPSRFNSSEYASIIAGKPSNWTIAYL